VDDEEVDEVMDGGAGCENGDDEAGDAVTDI